MNFKTLLQILIETRCKLSDKKSGRLHLHHLNIVPFHFILQVLSFLSFFQLLLLTLEFFYNRFISVIAFCQSIILFIEVVNLSFFQFANIMDLFDFLLEFWPLFIELLFIDLLSGLYLFDCCLEFRYCLIEKKILDLKLW